MAFARDDRLSPSSFAEGENRLYLADNLAVLRALAEEGTTKAKLVYVDPPFNTGRTFDQYADARTRDEWRAMMRPRLEACREVLRDDGALVAEIDDTELGSLQCLLDDVLGAENRVSTITVVRSAATGHKAKNRGPVNVADYLLVYAKKKPSFRPSPLFVPREGIDRAYRTFVEDPNAAPEHFRYSPLPRAAAIARGFGSARAARAALGAEWEAFLARFSIANAHHVARFAQVRFEAVSREAQEAIRTSKDSPERTIVLRRPGFSDMILRGGNRLLFLSHKVRNISRDGTIAAADDEHAAAVLSEPLTNVWTDVPFQGIAREGGVTFVRNKKPERLLERICALATAEGDLVIDPFLGSGTTCAVAQKTGRRWIGIESGAHGKTLALPRLAKVARGEDTTGIPYRRGATQGGFGVHRQT